MHTFCVVAEYRPEPAEGIQVVSKSVIDLLIRRGHHVAVVEPGNPVRVIWRAIRSRALTVVFTHGPGTGVVIMSFLLRLLTRRQIIWVATRPDLSRVPAWLRGRSTAHAVVCNTVREDLREVAPGAAFVQCYIGIDPRRTATSSATEGSPWPALEGVDAKIGLHVGHLRRNRGLDLLVEAKRRMGDALEVVVQGSPTFEPDPDVVDELRGAGIHVSRDYVPDLGRLYRAADVYLFPVADAVGGAIELPLGVLEAIANQSPVVSTDFGALPTALSGVPGVTLARRDDFVDVLVGLLSSGDRLVAPEGLPAHLDVARVADAVLEVAS